jgi:hypothetical protein
MLLHFRWKDKEVWLGEGLVGRDEEEMSRAKYRALRAKAKQIEHHCALAKLWLHQLSLATVRMTGKPSGLENLRQGSSAVTVPNMPVGFTCWGDAYLDFIQAHQI